MKTHGFFLCFFVLFFGLSIAQQVPESKNGKTLPAKGLFRILLVYVEINYDVNPTKDPNLLGSPGWQVHQLPEWKDKMFDAFPNESPSKGILTQFYKECSFDSFQVFGDYVSQLVSLNESEIGSVYWNTSSQTALNKLTKEGTFNTSQNLKIEDFDNWTMTGAGLPKISPSLDVPHKVDHIMFIFRNLPDFSDNSGMASQGSSGNLFGFKQDSYSIFRASSAPPFDIARHEFGHLLLGDNNFHSSGGQHGNAGANYFIQTLGGWGLLGGANSSLLTCNAWDRDRLDWQGPGKTQNISALNLERKEIHSDLDPAVSSDSGLYILRDFASTGDAMRIKIPYLVHGEFPQWLWIENHQTTKHNKSPFDKFHYQGNSCIDDATPGLYMYMQVDKYIKKGNGLYGGYADYLRPITADGFYDYTFGDSLRNNCINSVVYKIFEKNSFRQNPFTGNQDQEFPVADLNGDNAISAREFYTLAVERAGADTIRNLPYLGDKRDAFTLKGNKKIGIGTNPSTAPMITLVSENETKTGGILGNKGMGLPNNRKIILNGLSVEIVEELNDGSIKVKVRFNDVDVKENLRWCADTIILPAKQAGAEYSLNIGAGKTIMLDQGLTPTRIIDPITFQDRTVFASPTNLICSDSSFLHMEENSKLVLNGASTIRLKPMSRIELKKNAQMIVERGTKLIVEKGATLIIRKGAKVLIKGAKAIEYDKTSVIVDGGGSFKIRK